MLYLVIIFDKCYTWSLVLTNSKFADYPVSTVQTTKSCCCLLLRWEGMIEGTKSMSCSKKDHVINSPRSGTKKLDISWERTQRVAAIFPSLTWTGVILTFPSTLLPSYTLPILATVNSLSIFDLHSQFLLSLHFAATSNSPSPSALLLDPRQETWKIATNITCLENVSRALRSWPFSKILRYRNP